MSTATDMKINSAFAQDVLEGLTKTCKSLPSKYFYDDTGSMLFERIMELPSYYVTNAEFEVFSMHSEAIIEALSEGVQGIQLIELGAGNGLKTRLLLEAVEKLGVKATYTPIDISAEAIASLEAAFEGRFPQIELAPIVADYFQALDALEDRKGMRKVVMFLGSNIGNYTTGQSVKLLKDIARRLSGNDRLFVGFDLKKDPRTILAAYDDPFKVTKAFNMNLLARMNRELQANFNLPAFDHYAVYDPKAGEARSYLISLKAQEVYVGALEQSFHFGQWEYIHTEISRKYNDADIAALAEAAGYKVQDAFKDCRWYFANAILRLT